MELLEAMQKLYTIGTVDPPSMAIIEEFLTSLPPLVRPKAAIALAEEIDKLVDPTKVVAKVRKTFAS